jgi:hypothetical protein
MATPESWDDIVALYTGLETVAFWQPDGTLDVETHRGRERAPIGSWICRQADGTIEVLPLMPFRTWPRGEAASVDDPAALSVA